MPWREKFMPDGREFVTLDSNSYEYVCEVFPAPDSGSHCDTKLIVVFRSAVSRLIAEVERLRERNDRYEEALRKFKQIQYSGERYDNTTGIRTNRAACVFCGRFHNEHSHRDDCPFKVVNEVNG